MAFAGARDDEDAAVPRREANRAPPRYARGMEKVHSVPSGAAASATSERLELPSSIPEIDDDALDGALHRSWRARRLHRHLCKREDDGKPLSTNEVKTVVAEATAADGKPDGDQAVVIAEHARKHPEVFGGAHSWLLRFLLRVEWRLLIAELHNFIANLRSRSEEERKREELKRDRDQDRLEYDTRRTALLRMERANAERAPTPVDEELSEENRMRLTMERMKRT